MPFVANAGERPGSSKLRIFMFGFGTHRLLDAIARKLVFVDFDSQPRTLQWQ
jgi:hypothetical protein